MNGLFGGSALIGLYGLSALIGLFEWQYSDWSVFKAVL